MIIDTLRTYWIRSQRFQALSNPAAREIYVQSVIEPAKAQEADPKQRELLDRIAARAA